MQGMYEQLKQILTSFPILCKPDSNQPLLVYIVTIVEAINATLVQETDIEKKTHILHK